ncbi:run domain Beclin-1-interacting and cysteine-rich domain-containing protein-like isoform X9 [Littorina saxatilis]|uniref:run domain Beclin-1-interacting and cysteine-rich domain-containing protein-like isoform X9 n=1 Tax=Littorina saxatilis TaxID=31220 RepID=UPI0038B63109
MYENDSLGLGNVNMADTEDDNSESWPEECHHLLMGLKCTVERLLAVQTSNVWSTYGGFKRVSSHIEAILCHRIKVTQITSQSEGVFWSFVRGLKWLRPGMTSTMDRVSRSSSSAGQGGKGQLWLRESLQDHSLSSQLEILVSDPEHLHYHYQEGAFLRSEEYVTAMLICLRAVESNKVVNLADINPKLLQPHRPARVSDYNPTMSGANTSSSFDPHPPSHSAPDLDSSPSSTERQLSMDRYMSLHRGDSLFQPPAKGQSLMSYLSEQDFNYCALLEKENAHFGISDVLISVFEQMKWETSLRKYSLAENVSEEEESDEEINELKQRIRIRRRERLVEKAKIFPANSDGMNGTNTTSSMFTASSPVSSHGFSSLSDSSEQSDDADDQIELNFSGTETSNLAKLRSSGLSLSMASLYSDAELKKSNQSVESRGVDRQSSEKSNFSAEAIAMSLLSQFSEKRLPKASELEWLVSEKDAPQALLPLPNSFPISPDDGENADLMIAANKTKLRGNLEWAPPRAQIIFTIHQQEKRSVVLSRQNMRCAGCGTKAEHAFVRRLRYCEYVGKYFCQCCHGNDTEVIPGRVIMRWDFTRYYVSNFARDLLRKIRQQPLFHVDAINPALYKRVRTLDSVRDLRRQLGHLNTLLNICKRNDKWLEEVNKLPRHWTEDDNLYSLEDFAGVRSGEMPAVLKNIVAEAVRHVDSCTLCQGLGFICEICQGTDVIFPFQLSRSTLCPVCQACYHKSCYIPGKCPKCSRIELRRKRQSQMSPVETLKRTVWEGGGTRDSD